MIYLGAFIICAAVIFFAGKKLSAYGDLLAEKTGLSKGWIGIVLMASVTSLPELMVGISSAGIIQSADLATGDILGSCAFNLGILAMLDAFIPKKRPLTSVVSASHMLSAGLGIILLSLAGFSMFLRKDFVLNPFFALSTIILFIAYFLSINLLYRNEKKNGVSHSSSQEKLKDNSLKKIITNYVAFALVIIAAALTLPYFAEKLSDISGLGKSFVGTFLLAVSTSLPEIAVSIAAVRSGSVDLAVGNLLGSNIFNILILALDDVFYTKGILLHDASSVNMLSVFSTIIMSAIVVIGLSYKAPGKKYWLAWDAALIFIVYIINLVMLYRLT